MSNISVSFKALGSSGLQSISVEPMMKVRDFRTFAQTMLNFDDSKCRLVVERNGSELEDNQSFEEASIQSGDVLVLIPLESMKPTRWKLDSSNEDPASGFQQVQPNRNNISNQTQKAVYKLVLTVANSAQVIWEYSVQLEEYYENNPPRFYSDFGGSERKKFDEFLQQVLERPLEAKEVDRVLSLWCDDIVQGYRTTQIKL